MKFVILGCFHNRRSATLNSVSQLVSVFSKLQIPFEIILVDDNSSDGTSIELNKTFPRVQVVKGDGQLYWAGGMRLAWECGQRIASKKDHVLVFNDDIDLIERQAFELISEYMHSIRENDQQIFVGSFVDKRTAAISYGLWKNPRKLRPLSFERVMPNTYGATTFNMNFAIIPVQILKKIGFLKRYFVHGDADFEFGLRATKHSILICSPKVIGFCQRNSDKGTSRDLSLSKSARFLEPIGSKEQPIFQRLCYSWDLSKILFVPLFLSPYIKFLISLLFKKTDK
jgi:GT2 family glycosyltransferase